MGTFSTRDPFPVLIPKSGKPLRNTAVLSWLMYFQALWRGFPLCICRLGDSNSPKDRFRGLCLLPRLFPGLYPFRNCLSSCLQNRGKGDPGGGLVRTGLTAQTGTQVQSPSPTYNPDMVVHVCNLTEGDGSLEPVASQSLRVSGCQDGSVGKISCHHQA